MEICYVPGGLLGIDVARLAKDDRFPLLIVIHVLSRRITEVTGDVRRKLKSMTITTVIIRFILKNRYKAGRKTQNLKI
jgi:hypothetical protein